MEGRKSNRSLDSKSEKKPFIVDCVSAYSKMPEYDGLRDANLRAYFSSKRKRKLLVKRGSNMSKTSRGREANSVRKDSSDFFHSPEPSRSVYVTSQRSQSVKVNKTGKKLAMKPVTHGELQELFEKYKPKDVVPELPANPTEDVADSDAAPDWDHDLYPAAVTNSYLVETLIVRKYFAIEAEVE